MKNRFWWKIWDKNPKWHRTGMVSYIYEVFKRHYLGCLMAGWGNSLAFSRFAAPRPSFASCCFSTTLRNHRVAVVKVRSNLKPICPVPQPAPLGWPRRTHAYEPGAAAATLRTQRHTQAHVVHAQHMRGTHAVHMWYMRSTLAAGTWKKSRYTRGMHAAHARHIRGTHAVRTRRACSHTKHTKQRGARQEHEQNGATHNNTRKKLGEGQIHRAQRTNGLSLRRNPGSLRSWGYGLT